MGVACPMVVTPGGMVATALGVGVGRLLAGRPVLVASMASHRLTLMLNLGRMRVVAVSRLVCVVLGPMMVTV